MDLPHRHGVVKMQALKFSTLCHLHYRSFFVSVY